MSASISAQEWQVIALSLQVAGGALVLAAPWALFFGWLLARHDFPGKSIIETCLSLPLVLPPIVIGYLLLVAFGGHSWLGQWLQAMQLHLPFTTTAAVIAAALISFPLLLRAIQLSIAAIDPGLEAAASTLGASPLQVFRRVTLPLAWRGVVAGALLAFTRSLGEFGATVIFAGNTPGISQTIPLAIYSLDQAGTPQAEASAQKLVLIAIAIALLATGLSNWLMRPKEPKAHHPTHPDPGAPEEPVMRPEELVEWARAQRAVDAPEGLADKEILHLDVGWETAGFALRAACHIKHGITGISGPSGSGKTSLLRLLAGLEKPTSGTISWQASTPCSLNDVAQRQHTPPHQRDFGVVFQEDRLFPHLSVADNIRFGAKGKPGPGPEALAAMVGLSGLLHRMPETLSGGERQRVALARALACQPRMLLLDEPFNSLDPTQRSQLVALVLQIHTQQSLPILLISHTGWVLDALASRTLVMNQGTLVAREDEEGEEDGDGPSEGRG